MTPADFVERLAQTDFASFASYLDDSQFSQELSNVRCQTIQLTTMAGVIGRALFHDFKPNSRASLRLTKIHFAWQH
jgi:hypothetical protein